jgi:fibronectin-binding autotransporter adhesin
MLKPHHLLLVLAGLLGCVASAQTQTIWTGLGLDSDVGTPGNLQGGILPLNNGTANIQLGHALNNTLKVSGAYDFNSVSLTGADDYYITAASAQTLTLHAGLTVGSTSYNRLALSANITLNLAGAQTIDAGSGQVIVSGAITGSAPVTLLSSAGTSNGVFIFNNTGVGNTYSGNTTVGDGTNYVGVAFWNSEPFGTGSVTVLSGTGQSVQLIAHGTQTVTNAFTFSGPGFVSLRTWDAPLTYSGAFTLATDTIFSAIATQNAIPVPDRTGSLPLPGLGARNPIVFSGNISGAKKLTANGVGLLYLTGTNSYTGGTVVNGSLVFGGLSSAPGAGIITANANGYVGFSDLTTGNFATFFSGPFNKPGSVGAIGIDTLPGAAVPVTFSDPINLTGFNAALRIGTATRAILTGLITPQGTVYQFGNGGGTLAVQSALSGIDSLTLNNSNPSTTASPLTLYLQGLNTYIAGTTATNGFIVFDGLTALPAAGSLNAAGSNVNVGQSYIGYTDSVGITTPGSFLGKFNPASTWGILGFDTHAGNSTVSVNNINLTGFNDGVFIGTITSAIIDGSTITHSDVLNGNNAANTYRFTAGQNGVLTVNGILGGADSVMLGAPTFTNGNYTTSAYSSGTVIMNGVNTYTLGTTLNADSLAGLTLAFNNSNSLSTGALTVVSTTGGLAGLQATTGGLSLPNNIILSNVATFNGPQLAFTGTNNFTLSGNISSTDNTSSLNLFNAVPLTVNFSGNNSGFLGNINITNGTLNLQNNNAAGLGTVYFGGSAATLTFSGLATAPTLYGIKGGSGSVVIPGVTNVTFNVSDSVTHDAEFGGVVSGAGSVTVIAPTAPKAEVLYLYGNNTYSGGTTISGPHAVLALGSNTAAGTGMVTVNAPTGGLVLNSGVTFTNNLTFTTGALAGFGTFNPGGGPITFDTGRTVIPGLGNLSKDNPVGTLTFGNNVTFANGGTYIWSLQDVTRADGASLINITGNLNITATAGSFNFNIFSVDSTGNPGNANLTIGTPYSIKVLHTTGSISGFLPSDFTIDSSQFQNGPATTFTLSQSGSDIYLNFTPVPEPSTYALLGLGLGAVLLPALRRRRLVKS